MAPWVARPLIDLRDMLWGTAYTALKAGDIFEEHTHRTHEDNHITICTFGAARVLGSHHDGLILQAGPGSLEAIRDWPLDQSHGFEALVDGTTITNLRHVRIKQP